MQRWSRKKTHFPLLALALLVFIVCSILYNERNIQQIHEDSDHDHHEQEVPIKYVKPNLVNGAAGRAIFWLSFTRVQLYFLNLFLFQSCFFTVHVFVNFRVMNVFVLIFIFLGISEVLDRFSKCNSTKKYGGWKIGWADQRLQSGRRKVSSDSESCDVFSGKWVFDNTSYPLYNESQCPYMSDQLACHKHGRSDLGYQYWRWQPHNCNLKR